MKKTAIVLLFLMLFTVLCGIVFDETSKKPKAQATVLSPVLVAIGAICIIKRRNKNDSK